MSECQEFDLICDQSFVIEETPAVLLLKDALESRKTYRRLRLYYALKTARRFCLFYQVITVTIGLAASLLKHLVQLDEQQWEDLTLLRPVYHAIPLMFLSAVFIFTLLDSVGLAYILAMFHSLEQNPSAASHSDEQWMEDNDQLENKTRNFNFRFKSNLKVSRYLQQVLLGTNSAWQNLRGLPERLGSVTVVCTAGTAGILTDNVDYIEKICFFYGDKPTILELSRDPTPTGVKRMKFHDVDLKEECRSNLMPMVVNSTLNAHCMNEMNPSSPLHRALDPLLSHTFPYDQDTEGVCLCQLASELDFEEPLVSGLVPFFTIYQFADGTELIPHFPHLFGAISDSDELSSSASITPQNSVPSSPVPSSDMEDLLPATPMNEVSRRATRMRKMKTMKLLRNQHIDRFYKTETIVVQDPSHEAIQLMSSGDLLLLLRNCGFYWDGNDLRPFTDEDTSRLLDLESQWSAYKCVAFSYVPLDPHFLPFFNRFTFHRPESAQPSPATFKSSSSSSVVLGDHTASYNMFSKDAQKQLYEAQKGQMFIGFVAMRQLPRFEVPQFIESIGTAGFRYVHFSHQDQKASKIFAERMGLETDWNCAISLDQDSEITHDPSSPSQLPRGIDNIKDHVKFVDNIPLLVPLFYDSTPDSIKQMIELFQEYNEVVLCVGDCLDNRNGPIFATADVSIGMEPTPARCASHNAVFGGEVCEHKKKDRNSGQIENELERQEEEDRDAAEEVLISTSNLLDMSSTSSFSVDMASMPCTLVFPKDTSLFMIYHLLQEGRHWKDRIEQGLKFFFGAHIALSFLILLDYISFLPTIFNGVQIMWLVIVIIPLITLAIFLGPRDHTILNSINLKPTDYRDQLLKFIVKGFLLQIPLSMFLCLLVFGISFGMSWWKDGNANEVFGFGDDDLYKKHNYSKSQRIAQNMAMIAFVWFMIVWSSTFLQCTTAVLNLKSIKKTISVPWIFLVIVAFVAQVLFSVGYVHDGLSILFQRSSFLFVPIALWTFWILIVDWRLKIAYHQWFSVEQKFLKLELETKLGMYSPVDPYESTPSTSHLT